MAVYGKQLFFQSFLLKTAKFIQNIQGGTHRQRDGRTDINTRIFVWVSVYLYKILDIYIKYIYILITYAQNAVLYKTCISLYKTRFFCIKHKMEL